MSGADQVNNNNINISRHTSFIKESVTEYPVTTLVCTIALAALAISSANIFAIVAFGISFIISLAYKKHIFAAISLYTKEKTSEWFASSEQRERIKRVVIFTIDIKKTVSKCFSQVCDSTSTAVFKVADAILTKTNNLKDLNKGLNNATDSIVQKINALGNESEALANASVRAINNSNFSFFPALFNLGSRSIEAINNGDSEFFQNLYKSISPSILSFVQSIVSDAAGTPAQQSPALSPLVEATTPGTAIEK